MSDLTLYQKRRDFSQSREPSGLERDASDKPRKARRALSYVVQKHAARRLHYDFRLELGGVLLSWAVPKGPSLDPSVKRLAVEVEPHPLAYGTFEGQIAEGQYGAGAVMVWDTGSWESQDADPQAAYDKGHLSFVLKGQKLRGAWHLVRTRRGESDKQWLLFKSPDEFASAGENKVLEEKPDSALSGRSIQDIAKGSDAPPKRGRKATARADSISTASTQAKRADSPRSRARRPEQVHPELLRPLQQNPEVLRPLQQNPELPSAARKAKPPEQISLQLASLVETAPEGEHWLHEIKFDGYRILVRIVNDQVRLLTRRGLDWTERMPSLASAFKSLHLPDAIIDGEFVALDEAGVSQFQLLQNSLSSRAEAALAYYAFDLLHYNGYDLTAVPLLERKALLKQLLRGTANQAANDKGAVTKRAAPVDPTALVRLSEHVVGNGATFFKRACELKLEGIISKRASAPYQGGRSKDWLKIKCGQRQEFVIVGYTAPRASRSHFGALLVAVYAGERLFYCGRVGTGFTEQSLKELHQRMQALHSAPLAIENAPQGAQARGVQWLEPKLVAEVAFTAFTDSGILRHPSFEGLREDKLAKDVKRETSVKDVKTEPPPKDVKREAPPKDVKPEPPAKTRPATSAQKRTSPSLVHKLDTSQVHLTHPEKVMYADCALTKRDLLEHAALVAPLLLPHVVNRPLTLVRCPNGAGKPCFFQKHPNEAKIEGLRSVAIREKEGKSDYTTIDDVQGLFALVQLGALEIHTSGAHADDFEHPDVLVFDLDPDPELSFTAVVECAVRLREIFEQAALESFVKTTGGKGLHVCVPIAPSLNWDEAKAFTQRIAQALVTESPQRYVATQSKAQRTGKIFIDYLRNGRGATFVAPYSTRARPSAPIATPLFWEELDANLRPDQFTVANLPQRLATLKEDPFARLATLKQRLPGL